MLYRKFLLLLFAVMTVCAQANAAVAGDHLIVEMNDNSEKVFTLAETPVVEFGNGVVCITASNFTTEIEYSSINRIYFGDDSSSSETPDTPTTIDNSQTGNRFTFQYTDGQTVRMSGLKDANRVSLYSIDGKRMSMDTDRNGDEVTIHLGALPAGFYVIKANEQSFKIYKK